MTSNPLISVIIPTFNSSQTIIPCLNSVARLGFSDRELEIIIQDGQSTDDTLALVQQHPLRVKAISEKDRGVYDAMNNAIKRAEGTWLYFLGSNDMLLPEFKDAVHLLSNEYNMVYTNVYLKQSNKEYDGHFTIDKLSRKNICHQAIFYKKECIQNLKGFNLNYPLLADYALNMKLFKLDIAKIKYLNFTIAEFDETGISTTKRDLNFIYDKPKLLSELLPDHKTQPSFHDALLNSAEAQFMHNSPKTGIKQTLQWGSLTKRIAKSIYLILAFSKNRWLGSKN